MSFDVAASNVVGLADRAREWLECACRGRLPEVPFEVEATPWTVMARA